jgi:hypothetical protein
LSFATPKRPFGGQASATEALLLIPLKGLSAWNTQLRRRGGGIAAKAKVSNDQGVVVGLEGRSLGVENGWKHRW